MFSDQLKPISRISGNKMLFLAAALVLAFLLSAMVVVVGGQVQKAEDRQLSHANFQSAVAICLQSRQGSALSDCVRLASAAADSKESEPKASSTVISAPAVDLVTLSNRY